MQRKTILILGGTTQARQLAERLAGDARLSVTLSLAGRTVDPVAHAVPVISGGFGGAEGLAEHLAREGVDVLVDATHPYAARMSHNAAEAARISGVPLVALARPAWTRVDGDRWREVAGSDEAVEALGAPPRRVFLALGRQEIAAFERAPQHSYVIRSVDPVEPKLAVPDATYILARGPFDEEAERRLLEELGIAVIVAKNSGGAATYGKIAAARELGIELILFARPAPPGVPTVNSVQQAVAAIDHLVDPSERGV